MKKTFTSQQKAQVALVAIKGKKTISQIASLYEVHPTQIQAWKKQALSALPDIFSDKRKKENQTQDQLIDELYKTVGQRDIELEWLKKKLEFNS
jgi:transposase-like protein